MITKWRGTSNKTVPGAKTLRDSISKWAQDWFWCWPSIKCENYEIYHSDVDIPIPIPSRIFFFFSFLSRVVSSAITTHPPSPSLGHCLLPLIRICIICDDEEFIAKSILMKCLCRPSFLACLLPLPVLFIPSNTVSVGSFPHFSTEIINYRTRFQATSKMASCAGRCGV